MNEPIEEVRCASAPRIITRTKRQGTDGTQQCSMCKEWLPLHAFWSDRRMLNGRYFRCKKCCKTSSTRTTQKQRRQKYGRIVAIHRSMVARCYCQTCKGYKHYGGRGITVCQEWRKFKNFLRDMGPAPDDMSIERIDNDGPYCKENCRWATNFEQQRNTRRNRWIEFNGVRLILTDWARKLGISHASLSEQLKRRSIGDILKLKGVQV